MPTLNLSTAELTLVARALMFTSAESWSLTAADRDAMETLEARVLDAKRSQVPLSPVVCAAIAETWSVSEHGRTRELTAFDAVRDGQPVMGLLSLTTCDEGFAPPSCTLRLYGEQGVTFEPTPARGLTPEDFVSSLLHDAHMHTLLTEHPRGERCTTDTFVVCPADRDPDAEHNPYAGLSNAEIDELQR